MTKSSMRYAHHLARVFNRPLLMEQLSFDAMLPGLRQALLGGESPLAPEAVVTVARERSEHTGLRMEGAVAVIPVMGPLVHRGHYDADCQYLQGYQDIASMARAVGADPAAKAAVLVFDSPGGEVAGCFETADALPGLLGGKPHYAMVNDRATSAAYALACTAKEIVATKTAYLGSIGVLIRHEDYSGLMEKAGIGVTLITAGSHKADGNPYEALPEAVRADLQAECNKLQAMFIESVAGHRKGLSAKALLAMEARVYMAGEAIKLGLADRIGTTDGLITEIAQALSEDRSIATTFGPRANAPSSSSTTGALTNMPLPDAVAAALGVPADAPEGQVLTSIQTIATAAAASERARVMGILNHPKAQANMPTAIALAGNAAMTADGAAAVLATIPEPISSVLDVRPGPSQFSQMMSKLNPDVGPNDEADDDDDARRTQEARAGWVKAFGLDGANRRQTF